MAGPDAWIPAVRLHQLEGFYYVTTHAGYTRAAEAMPYAITEPALHQQVRKLEKALGVRLLERAPGRRMVSTPAGRALYAFVAPYFEGLPGVLRQVADGGATLVVGAEPLFVEGLIAEVLTGLRKTHPAAQLRLIEVDGDAQPAALTVGRIDVGLTSPLPDLPTSVVYEPLGAMGLELWVPAGHPLASRRGKLGGKQLDGLECVMYEAGSPGRAFGERALAEAGIGVTVVAEASTAAALQALARSGLAPAFVPSLRTGKPRRRRTLPDGTVAFDLTGSLETLSELPPFGLVRRARPAPTGLLAEFCERVSKAVARAAG